MTKNQVNLLFHRVLIPAHPGIVLRMMPFRRYGHRRRDRVGDRPPMPPVYLRPVGANLLPRPLMRSLGGAGVDSAAFFFPLSAVEDGVWAGVSEGALEPDRHLREPSTNFFWEAISEAEG